MRRVCMVMADGFEEIEAITIIDVLRRAEVEVTVLGLTQDHVRGAHGIEVATDGILAGAPEIAWDLVVLPGGLPNAETLRDSSALQTLLQDQATRGGKIGAICAAPIALGAAGLLEGKQATCYPGFEDGLVGARPMTETVVQDGQVMTSRGPGTAMAFSLALVEALVDPAKAATLAEQLLV